MSDGTTNLEGAGRVKIRSKSGGAAGALKAGGTVFDTPFGDSEFTMKISFAKGKARGSVTLPVLGRVKGRGSYSPLATGLKFKLRVTFDDGVRSTFAGNIRNLGGKLKIEGAGLDANGELEFSYNARRR